ncbi:MAG: lytic transglycosylase domain-containing protein [Myxococcaceae bacterium]|nr:lytic transglycosylase domain-containing protein [Myxococcaceae bacterium]
MRAMWRLFLKLRWWQQGLVVVLTPLTALNLAVAFFGQTVVSPLSPFYLDEKAGALGAYFKHRPGCVLKGHGDLADLAKAAEKREKLPAGLMQAIVWVESENEAHRISYAGAMGPAQLMPGTAADLGVKDPFDPEESISAGARYLKRLLERTGRLDLAVAAYNAGPGNVHGRVPQIGQTQVYVAKVMKRYHALKAS